jgi:ubiquinone/menaquinone biosynthesis C-methylase UbiE
MDFRIKVYFSKLSNYKNKLIQILFFEIFYTLKFRDFYYKIHNNTLMTDALPCPYYFLYKISKFIKKKNISGIADFGSGTGRVVNFLASSTNKYSTGYEIDKELVNYSISKKRNEKAHFVQGDFNQLSLNNINSNCYIFNTPLKREQDILSFIQSISKMKKKFFLVVINIDSHLSETTINKFFKDFILSEFIKAGKTKTLRIYENNFF